MCWYLAPAVSRALAADAPPAVPTELHAHGNDEWYWIAKVGPSESDAAAPQTIIQARNNATNRWVPMARIDARVLAIANRGTELGVIQEKNHWSLLWRNGGTLGQPLPRGAIILSLAGDATSLWALGRGEVGPVSTTKPSTAAVNSASRTSPTISTATISAGTISAATSRPIATALYEWNVREWVPRAILSDDLLIGEARDVSVALIGSRPVLAARDRDGNLRVVRLESDGRWTEQGKLPRQQSFKLLVTGARPMLWLSSGGAAGSIVPLEQLTDAPTVLPPPVNLAESDPRAIAAATGQLRLVYMHEKKLYEQAYSPTGEKRGEPNQLVAVVAPTIDTWQHWLALTMLVLLTLFVFGPARRRADNIGGAGARTGPGAADATAAESSTARMVAPPRLRLQAGVLDALPLILVSFFIVAQSQASGMEDLYDRATYLNRIWLWIGAYAVYFLHTLISELLTGRTLGKWIFGLRVTKLDGTRPRPMAFLVRNFVRVLEFHLLLPLIVIVFSPLHQRIGDMAAGTIVVADDLPAREEDKDENE
ncbi:MAG: RDD family protein [Anaerolineae bacterium]|nr:RDD family protein [Phycisphaerae bacterium]